MTSEDLDSDLAIRLREAAEESPSDQNMSTSEKHPEDSGSAEKEPDKTVEELFALRPQAHRDVPASVKRPDDRDSGSAEKEHDKTVEELRTLVTPPTDRDVSSSVKRSEESGLAEKEQGDPADELLTPVTPPTDRDVVPEVPRQQGDGAFQTEPHTEMTSAVIKEPNNPFSINVDVDLMQVALFVLAVGTRMWRLDYPNSVVFDEVHYMRQVGWYLNRTFFFDHHPPLSKMFFALAGYMSDYNPGPVFENVGQEYSPDVPIGYLRLFPALFGSLLVPTVYQILVELGMKRWTAAIAATLVLCENSFLTQARLVMAESILLFTISFTIMALLKFLNRRSRAFSLSWWFWLITLGAMVAVTASVKYIGAMTSGLVLFIAFRDLWYMMADLSYTGRALFQQTLARLACLVVLPATLYLGIFYVHLSVLVKAGPTDNVMTSSFQASLEGGLAAITKGQPLYVAYGSQVTLHRTFGPEACWLHSHDALYPVRYDDNRGSSHQQQVTCYGYKDANNWWFINKPDSNNTKVADPPERIKDGDIVQIYHGLTKRPLNSHDVGAPMTPSNMEVSCYIDHNVNMSANTLWRVEVLNKYNEGEYWQTIRSHVRLIHVNTTSALRVTGVPLPNWAFGQKEVVADKNMFQDSAIWNVEEHIYPKDEQDKEAEDIRAAPLIPSEPVYLSFWDKFKELQMKMLSSRVDEEVDHRYASDPLDWPLDDKNVAYWLRESGKGTSAQIHLLGNMVSWYSALPGFLLFVLTFVGVVLARKRSLAVVREDYLAHMTFVAELLIGGYLLNYLPFFIVESTYFLYHYLPAVLFKLIFVAILVEQIYSVLAQTPRLRYLAVGMISMWMTAVVLVFYQYFGLSCGYRQYTNEQLRGMVFRCWDFIMVETSEAKHIV